MKSNDVSFCVKEIEEYFGLMFIFTKLFLKAHHIALAQLGRKIWNFKCVPKEEAFKKLNLDR